MKTIANCYDVHEASYLKMLLEASGIPAFIPDEATALLAPHQFLTPSGVRVQVLEEHAEEAAKILEEYQREKGE